MRPGARRGLARLVCISAIALSFARPAFAGPIAWRESFAGPSIDWVDPLQHTPAEISQIYTLRKQGAETMLHARHDRSASSKPPAIHYGHAFQSAPVPLDKIKALRWKWRATLHPKVDKDPWADLAVSVYVLIRRPSLLHAGRGFKLGWTAKPAPDGHQRGLLEHALRSDAASDAWQSESVDLCALYQKEYGAPCAGETVQYVGVVTDADNTRSIAEGDYAAFELELR